MKRNKSWFVKIGIQMVAVLFCLLLLSSCLSAAPSDVKASTRCVWAFSDMHAGNATKAAGNVDGAEWLQRACTDLKTNSIHVDYTLVLGDITAGGLVSELDSYRKVCIQNGMTTRFELAGNHEYAKDGKMAYAEKIRPAKPYCVVDGNIAWFFLSDEKPGVPGDLSETTLRWLDQKLTEEKDKIIIICSHQLVYDTVKTSTKGSMFLNPAEQVKELLAKHHVDVWLSGHEHHSPWTEESMIKKDETWFINVASLSYAYNTGESQSFLLEFTEGDQQIKVRRRIHDKGIFAEKGTFVIPLQRAIKLGTPVEVKNLSL
jgi:predicted phosphodiesterase